jgi:hypothetical protein
MKSTRISAAVAIFPLILLSACAAPAPMPTPLIHAHAHNDYDHPHPLLDALGAGFTSIEADIFLRNDTLFVAHEQNEIISARTLKSLYLDPLRRTIRANRGHVYASRISVTLLIDIKSAAIPTYAKLREVLADYDDLLTHFGESTIAEGPLAIILTGNAPRQIITAEPHRIVACDGRLSDLDSNSPAAFVPLISANWENTFTWRGDGPFPDSERAKLEDLVKRTHAQHRKLRFWAAPDNELAWRELRRAGVDLINTDHLQACREFLLRMGEENVPRH